MAANAAAPFAYLVRAVEYRRAAFPATLLPVAPDCTVLVSGAFLGLSVAAVASVTAADNRLTVRKARDLAGPLTVRRRTATGGVWEAAVGTDGAVELAAGDILEAADGTAVCALLVCPARLPDTAAEQTDLSIAEKLAEAEKFNGELQRKVLELEQRLAKQKKKMRKEQEKHEDEDYVEAPKRKRGRPPAAS